MTTYSRFPPVFFAAPDYDSKSSTFWNVLYVYFPLSILNFPAFGKKCFESENISLDMMRGNTGGPVGISKSYFLNTFNFVFRKIFIEFIIVITILMWLNFYFLNTIFQKLRLPQKKTNFLSTFKFLILQVLSKIFHDFREMLWEFRETSQDLAKFKTIPSGFDVPWHF